MKKIGIITIIISAVILIILTLPTTTAITRTGHITLLAVYEENGIYKGSPADVTLQIEDGYGRVFLETVPLSKVDTQMSTRFAKKVACKFSKTNCENYDFFYTIKSQAGIVGGPSAGAAITALTVSMLEDYDIKTDVAITGTINSGEVIGPVGSLKAKVDAAKTAGLTKVIIPLTSATEKEDNITGVIKYGKEIGIEVVPVSVLSEALTELTNVKFPNDNRKITVPKEYEDTMMEVAEKLCSRADKLINNISLVEQLKENGEINLDFIKQQKEAINFTKKADIAFKEKNYYSAASFCLGAAIRANTLIYDSKNLNETEYSDEMNKILLEIDSFDKKLEKQEKSTITDLQTYMIVKERVLEARHQLKIGKNNSLKLAYITERLNSAKIWSVFFGKSGETYDLDQESLEQSCVDVLKDVEERFQYLNLYFPGLLVDLKTNLLSAEQHYQNGEPILCVYIAKRTKAEANIMVSLLGVSEDAADEMLKQKLDAARKSVNKQIDHGIFPIMAYSYHEYADSLMNDNDYAAAIYAEYALELSDIDIYFEKKNNNKGQTIKRILKNYAPTLLFIWGVIIGFMLCYVIKTDSNICKRNAQKNKKVENKKLRNKKIKNGVNISKEKTNISLRE